MIHIHYTRTAKDGSTASAVFHFEGTQEEAIDAFNETIEMGDSVKLVVTNVEEV